MGKYRKGERVSWAWGEGRAYGKVEATYTRKVTRTLKGSQVTRNGSENDPALYIEQEDGDGVLKLESEVRRERD